MFGLYSDIFYDLPSVMEILTLDLIDPDAVS